MNREYTYAELCRMSKKRVIRIAGFKNMKELVKTGFNRNFSGVGFNGMPTYKTENASKKYIAKIIASDK